jgi:hypothetical protein
MLYVIDMTSVGRLRKDAVKGTRERVKEPLRSRSPA